MTKRTCTIDGCDQLARSRGWCNGHYMRWFKNGDPGTTPIKFTNPDRGCLVEGCGSPHAARGYCGAHYKRVMEHGHPGGAQIKPRVVPDAEVDYALAHARLGKRRGKASGHQCVGCENQARHWAYDHADPNEKTDARTGAPFSVDLNHYEPMCASCHKAADMQRIREANPSMTVGIDPVR